MEFPKVEDIDPSASEDCRVGTDATKSEDSDSQFGTNVGAVTLKKFSIDRSQIALAKQCSSELQDLQLNVYNQDDFEEGVMAQLNKVVDDDDNQRIDRLLEVERKNVSQQLRELRKEIAYIDQFVALHSRQLEQQSHNQEAQTRLQTLKRQKETKTKEINKLKAVERTLKRKFVGERSDKTDDKNVEALHELLELNKQPKQETERERLIRLGIITPFDQEFSKEQKEELADEAGSFETPSVSGKDDLKQSGSARASERLSERVIETSVEANKVLVNKASARLNDKDSSNASHKQSVSETDAGGDVAACSTTSLCEPDINSDLVNLVRHDVQQTRHRVKRKWRSWMKSGRPEDGLLSGDEKDDLYSSGDEWEPEKKQLRVFDESEDGYHSGWSDEETDKEKVLVSARRKKKIDLLAKQEQENFFRTKTVKKEAIARRVVDDGSAKAYVRRLKEYRRQELSKKYQQIESDLTVDPEAQPAEELEGGLKVPGKLWVKLYRYQKTGVRWLWELHQQQCGGIVGDEMGLGKTIQVIVFLAALRESKLRSYGTKYIGLGPSLIVVPATVMHQWVREFHTWWPPFRVAVLHETGSFSGSKASLVQYLQEDNGMVITSYTGLVQHQKMLLKYDWHYIILDEGHKIRNPDAQATLAAKQFRSPHRLILSGSPVQNNLKELWSLFDFVFPGKLGTLPVFMQEFSVPITQGGYANANSVQVMTAYKCACMLRDTISPYLLRRMKADVKSTLQLPNKSEQVLFCRLTQEQRDVYKEYLKSDQCQSILTGNFQIFVGLITLRKICNHPDLSTGGPRVFRSDDPENEEPEKKYGYWKRSGKLIVIEALLKLWHKQKHRALLFSQSKQMLDILESFVQDCGYKYLRMDGETGISTRQPLISKFNKDDSIFLFLLTTRVGGLGVNLTGADRVIIYDPDWNPSTDIQARERSWRIGQDKNVTIYRLMTSGTIEEKIYHRQIFKQFLTNRVLKDPKQRRFFKSNDIYELFTLKEDDVSQTETGAIFAGTRSEITPRLRGNKKQESSKADSTKRDKKNEDKKSKVVRPKSSVGKTARQVLPASLLSTNFCELKSETQSTTSLLTSDNFEVKCEDADAEESLGCESRKPGRGEKISTDLQSSFPEENREDGSSEVENVEHEKDQNKLVVAHSDSLKTDVAEQKTDQLSIEGGYSNVSVPFKESGIDNHEGPNRFVSNVEICSADNERKLGKKTADTECQDSVETGSRKIEDERKVEKMRALARKLSIQIASGKYPKRLEKHKQDDDKKKRKRKKNKQAKLDGKRIPHLDKQTVYEHSEKNDEEHKHHDDYVLRTLFKRSGVHSALKHDNIIESSSPDYLLVEAEADLVAKNAVAAMKQSREQCLSAVSGVPTWTGLFGSSGIRPGGKPRFGQKQNTRPTAASRPAAATSVGKSAENCNSGTKNKRMNLFTGKSFESGGSVMTSGELIARIQARKQGGAETQGTGVSEANSDLLADIRNCIAFQCKKDGEATTTEILERFKEQLPADSSLLFKSLLKEICDFHRTSDGEGVWTLKPDFR